MPSLDTFRIFDAAARHLSFKSAAAELHITPAAVSQRIRQLEAELGMSLFRRLTRQIALTDEGAELAREVRRAIGIIEGATMKALQSRANRPIVLSTTPTFAEQLLLPVLGALQARVQGGKVRVMVTDELVHPGRDGVDLAIRQGSGQYPNLISTPLMRCTYVPVCAARALGVMNHLPVAHVQWPERVIDAPSWAGWAKLTGLDINLAERPELHVSTEAMAIRSALAGQSVALVAREHVERELAEAHLVLPFGQRNALTTPHGYHLVCAEGRASPAVRQVHEWILRQFTDIGKDTRISVSAQIGQ